MRAGPRVGLVFGLLGSAMIALGVSLPRDAATDPSQWWRALLTLPGTALLVWGWWRLTPQFPRPMAAAAVWSLPLLFSWPVHSRDVFAYAAQGELVAAGLNPYQVPAGAAPHLGHLVGEHWQQTTSVYPPGSLQIFGLAARFTDHPYWAVVAQRLPQVVGLLITAWALARLASRFQLDPRLAIWAGIANPVVLVQWIGGVHNEALMVAVLSLAALCITTGADRNAQTPERWWRWLAAGVLLGIAMLIKQSAAVAGVGLVAVGWAAGPRRTGWVGLIVRAAVAAAVTVGTFVAASFASGLGFGWLADSAGSPTQAVSFSPLGWLGYLAQGTSVESVFTVISGVVILVALGWLWWKLGPWPPRVGRPWALFVSSLAVVVALGPALQPWYLTAFLPFVALADPGPRGWRVFVVVTALTAAAAPLQDGLPPPLVTVLLIPLAVALWPASRQTAV